MTANFGSEAEGAQIAIGRVSDVLAGPGTTTSIHVDYDYSRPARATAYYSLAPWTSESGSQAIGAFLYRQAAVVPEPTTVSLLAAGLMLLIWRSRTVGTRA
nr:PEP-CTERM sorting domain-containing protein [Duganella guangzhouensis]